MRDLSLTFKVPNKIAADDILTFYFKDKNCPGDFPRKCITVKILKNGTPEIITIIVLQLEQLDFTVQYCVQKMQTEKQTEKTLIRLLHEEQSDLGLHCLLRPICPNI